MARTGWSASNFLRHAAGIVTAAPLTIAGFGWTSVTGASQTIAHLCNSASATALNAFRIGVNTDNTIFAQTGDGSAASTAFTSTTISGSTPFHWAGVFDITTGTDRAAFLNGAGKGTQTTNRTPTGINRFSLGLRDNASADQPFAPSGTGYLAMVGLWNTNLLDAEIALLSAGVAPWQVRPASLVDVWPMIDLTATGDEMSWGSGGHLLSEQGALTSGPFNPPVAMPFPWMRPAGAPLIEVAAAPGFAPSGLLIGL